MMYSKRANARAMRRHCDGGIWGKASLIPRVPGRLAMPSTSAECTLGALPPRGRCRFEADADGVGYRDRDARGALALLLLPVRFEVVVRFRREYDRVREVRRLDDVRARATPDASARQRRRVVGGRAHRI